MSSDGVRLGIKWKKGWPRIVDDGYDDEPHAGCGVETGCEEVSGVEAAWRGSFLF